MKDLKQLHKLNEKNYKKLAIISRSIQIVLLDCGYISLLISGVLFVIKLTILPGKPYWICGIMIILTLIYITTSIKGLSVPCLYIIMFSYYTMIFDQINRRINLISDDKATFFNKRNLTINKEKQKQLISLMHEHNSAKIKIDKINLIIKRSVGCFFITFAIINIISLYLIVNVNDIFVKMFLIVLNSVIFLCGFSGSYFFTLQIRAAHRPLKTIHSMVCKYKMNLELKLKVSLLINILSYINQLIISNNLS